MSSRFTADHPAELVRGRPQTADDVGPVYAGSYARANPQDPDGRGWYVAGRYLADDDAAAAWRRLRAAEAARWHLRALRWIAREVRAQRAAFPTADDLRAFALRRATERLGAPLSATAAARLERAASAAFLAFAAVADAPTPARSEAA